jgi:hypothetical protein
VWNSKNKQNGDRKEQTNTKIKRKYLQNYREFVIITIHVITIYQISLTLFTKVIQRLLSMFVCLMLFNATFNNISVISWLSVLLVEETGVPRRKPPTCHKPLTKFIA